MAEFNPYKLEEEKWTPNNVYEILPPNAVSWSDYEFGQGTDNVDQEAASKSLIDGFVDFFKELFGTAGKILGGAVELGGAILGGFVNGVVNFIGGIANAIGSIFGGGSGESPNLPLFNPIKTNLEAAIQPQRDKINESLQKTEEILAEQAVLRGQMAESLQDMRDARDRANEAIEKSGQSIEEAQAASAAATEARETLENYNTALNQRITTEFNSAVGRADTAVEKADTLAGELADFKEQNQREIDSAVSKAEQAVADLATLSPQIQDAVDKSNKATADVSTLTPKVSDAAEKAGEATEKALAALNAPDSGASLMPVNPLTNEPYYLSWAGTRDNISNLTAVPERVGVRQYATEKVRYNAGSNDYVLSKLNKGTVYRWSVWVYSSVAGSDMRFFLKDPVRGVSAKRVTGDNEGVVSNSTYGIWLTNVPQGWSKQSGTIEFDDEADYIYMYAMEWNVNQLSVEQYFAGLDIYPDVPTQAQVDAAQNKAIEAFDLFIDNQDEWNKGTKAALDAQKKVDDNFQKWTEGAEKAIQANTDVAVALARINGIQMGGRNLLKKSNVNVTNKNYRIAFAYFGDSVPQDGEEITISVKGSLGAGKTYFNFYNSGGSTYIDGVSASARDSNGVYKVVTKWKADGIDSYLNIYAVPESVSATSTIEWIKLERGNQASDWTPAPEDLPTQKQVDDAQSDAIRANTEALKALGKKALGASLVPYKTPSTQEVKDYAAGKLNYDPWADPEYFGAGYFVVNPMRGRVVCASPDQGFKEFKGSYVSVDSSIEYKVKFHTYAASYGSKMYIHMYDQNGSLAIAETPFADSGRGSGDLVNGITLPRGLKEWSGVVKFKPGTTEVCLGNFYWNDPSGSIKTSQEFGGLEIVPNIPDANVVNELQDNAIRKNTEVGSANKQAIEALKDGLNASIELGEVNGLIEGLRGDLAAEQEKRQALQTKIDELQTEMIPRTIVKDDRVTYDDYVSLDGNTVTAKGNWAGQLAITYTYRSGSGTQNSPYVYETLVTRKSVPDGMTRSWKIGYSIQRVDYWVYRGRPRTILLINAGPYITGSTFSNGTWGVLAAGKVGKTYGTGKIEWRANLLNADRDTTYRFAIKVNGVEVKNVYWKDVGPLTFLGDGKRTLKFEHEFNLPDDATVEVLGYATGDGGSHQAKVSLLQGTLVYVEDESR